MQIDNIRDERMELQMKCSQNQMVLVDRPTVF